MSIFYDSDAFCDPSTASKTVIPTPENTRELPCEDCPRALQCANEFVECKAFRNWCADGDFDDADIARLLRAPKKF